MLISTVTTFPVLPSAVTPLAQRLARALSDLQAGRPVLLMDDFDRENEADLIIAAEKITTDSMARLIRDCSGIVCLCLSDERLQQLVHVRIVRMDLVNNENLLGQT